MKQILKILLPVLFFCLKTEAQSDSELLLKKINSIKLDTSNFLDFMHIATAFKNEYPDTAVFFHKKAIAFCRNHNMHTDIGACFGNLSNIEAERGNFDSALEWNDSSILYRQLYDQPQLGSCFKHRANIFQSIGRYEQAMEEYMKALKLLDEKSNPSEVTMTYHNLVYLLNSTGKHELAIGYCEKQLALAEKYNVENEIGWACVNFSESYRELKMSDKARPYIIRLFDIAGRNDDPDLKVSAFSEMGTLKMFDNDYPAAVELYIQAIELNKKRIDNYSLCNNYNNLAAAYHKLKQTKEAKKYLQFALDLSFQIDGKESRKETYRLLAENSELTNDYKSAYRYSKLLQLLSDSLLNEKSQQALLDIEAKYQSEKIKDEKELKEQQIELLEKDKKLKDQELVVQKRLQLFLVVIFIGLLLTLGLVFNRYQLKKKIERQQALLAERSRISRDMHDDLGSGLSKIAFLSEVVMQNNNQEQIKKQLAKISSSAREAIVKTGEIVWSLNPKNDSLENLASYLRKYTGEYFEQTGIECHFNFPDELPVVKVSGEQRRNIFLAVKEALHNVMKHSGADSIDFTILKNGDHFEVKIHDNGKGIDVSNPGKFCNGLITMKNRTEAAGGYFFIENGSGTTVRLGIKLKGA